jgi:hypothetical protein
MNLKYPEMFLARFFDIYDCSYQGCRTDHLQNNLNDPTWKKPAGE